MVDFPSSTKHTFVKSSTKRSAKENFLYLFLFFIAATSLAPDFLIPQSIFSFKELYFFFVLGITLLFISINPFIVSKLESLHLNVIDKLVLLFLTYIIINNVFKGASFISIFNSFLLEFGCGLLYLFVKLIVTKGCKGALRLYYIIFSLMVSQIVIGVLQFCQIIHSRNPFFTVVGFFFNPAPYAIYLSALFVFLLPYIFSKSSYNNFFYFFAKLLILLLCISLIFICYSRASWVGMISGIIAMLIFLRMDILIKFFNKKNRKLITISLFFILIIIFGIFLFSLKKESSIGRILTWDISLSIFKNSPITGVGINNFPQNFINYQYLFFNDNSVHVRLYADIIDEISFAFNDLFQILTEEGILGFGIFITLLGIIFLKFKKAYKKKSVTINSNIMLSAFSAILVILISGFFSYPLEMLPIKIYFFILIAIISAQVDTEYHTKTDTFFRLPKKAKSFFYIVPIVAVAIFYIFYGSIRYFAFNKAKTIIENNYQGDNDKYLLDLYPILADNSWYLMSLSRSLEKEKRYSAAIQILKKAKDISSEKQVYYALGRNYEEIHNYELAEINYMFVSVCYPKLLTPKFLLAKLYYTSKQKIKWQKMSNEIVKFKPKFESYKTFMMQEIIQEMIKNEKQF